MLEALSTIIINFDNDGINKYNDMVSALVGKGSYSYAKKLGLDLKNRTTPLPQLSIEEPPILELKALYSYLHYPFLGATNNLSFIIIADLVNTMVEALFLVLQRFK